MALRHPSPEASVLEVSLNELSGSRTEAGVDLRTLRVPSLLTVNSFLAFSGNSDSVFLGGAWGFVSWGEAD